MNNNEKQNKDDIKASWLKKEKYLRILIIKILCVIGLIIISFVFASKILNILCAIISLISDTLSILSFLKIYPEEE